MSTIHESIRAVTPTISVGMLTADLLRLGEEIQLLQESGVRLVHFDVMDGRFCPMNTFGPPIVGAVDTSLWKDVHLMIEAPLEKLESYVAAGADLVTVHVESDPHIHRVLQRLGELENANDPARGLLRGVALNPGTPVTAIEPLLDEVELVLLLAVNPGFRGQRFAASTPRRLELVRERVSASGRDILVGVDGGVTRENLSEIAGLGPDLIVTGSAVFDGRAPAENARGMLDALARLRRSAP